MKKHGNKTHDVIEFIGNANAYTLTSAKRSEREREDLDVILKTLSNVAKSADLTSLLMECHSAQEKAVFCFLLQNIMEDVPVEFLELLSSSSSDELNIFAYLSLAKSNRTDNLPDLYEIASGTLCLRKIYYLALALLVLADQRCLELFISIVRQEEEYGIAYIKTSDARISRVPFAEYSPRIIEIFRYIYGISGIDRRVDVLEWWRLKAKEISEITPINVPSHLLRYSPFM